MMSGWFAREGNGCPGGPTLGQVVRKEGHPQRSQPSPPRPLGRQDAVTAAPQRLDKPDVDWLPDVSDRVSEKNFHISLLDNS